MRAHIIAAAIATMVAASVEHADAADQPIGVQTPPLSIDVSATGANGSSIAVAVPRLSIDVAGVRSSEVLVTTSTLSVVVAGIDAAAPLAIATSTLTITVADTGSGKTPSGLTVSVVTPKLIIQVAPK